MHIMGFKKSISSALVLVCLIVLSSVVSLKASLDIPEFSGALMLENGNTLAFYEPDVRAGAQNKSLVNACNRVITREPIITYLEKQENSPPGA